MRKGQRLVSLILCVVLLASALPVFAMTDASKQIASYSMDARWSGDRIYIDFTITAAGGIADELGAEEITVYRKSGLIWVYEAGLTRDDEDMTCTDDGFHTYSVYYNADTSYQYKVVITVFAENSQGYDSRTRTFYL